MLIQFNLFTIVLGASSLLLIAIYPFMKRITFWPQLVLGLTFKWGALVGWAAVTGSLSLAAVALYAGSVLWTIGYDTIYAHQDKEDDALLGLKSTALRFGEATPRWLVLFYTGAVVLWGAAGMLAGAHIAFAVALSLAAAQMAWQVATLDTSDAQQLPGTIQVEPAGRLAAVWRAGSRHGAVGLHRSTVRRIKRSGIGVTGCIASFEISRLPHEQRNPSIGAIASACFGMHVRRDRSKLWRNSQLRTGLA